MIRVSCYLVFTNNKFLPLVAAKVKYFSLYENIITNQLSCQVFYVIVKSSIQNSWTSATRRSPPIEAKHSPWRLMFGFLCLN